VIEPRLYRAAFVPAILAIVVAAFSLQPQPRGVSADASADILFDGKAAADQARLVSQRFPDRAPGSEGDRSAAEYVGSELNLNGFEVVLDRWTDRDLSLVNVVATRTGGSRQRIVVMAPRDARTAPDLAGSAADTAALLQLGDAFEGRATEKTIVLVSYDASSYGQEGVERFLETAEDDPLIQAIVPLSSMGAAPPARPGVVTWSDDLRLDSIGLTRTLQGALLREVPGAVPLPGVSDQLAHLVLPVGIGPQGFLLSEGYDAARISGTGEGPPPTDQVELDPGRFGSLGKAVLQALSALDEAAPLEHGPETFVTFSGQVLPSWPVSLLAVALIIPALVASIDAAARARRRREAVLPWVLWLARPCGAFMAGFVLALLLGLLGIAPASGGSAPVPGAAPFDAGAVVLLLLVAAAGGGAWAALRPIGEIDKLTGADRTIPAAGVGASLALGVVALLVWMPIVGLGNPFAALVLVLPLHLWMLATLGDAPMHGRTRMILYVLGLVPAGLVATYHLFEMGIDPVSGAWYLFQLVVGGQLELRAGLLMSLFLGIATAVLVIVITQARGARATPGAPRLKGPASGDVIFSAGSRR